MTLKEWMEKYTCAVGENGDIALKAEEYPYINHNVFEMLPFALKKIALAKLVKTMAEDSMAEAHLMLEKLEDVTDK